jgi:predicted nucleic acid-binding protein
MVFVVDASVTACWLMPDESHPSARAAFELLDRMDAAVPAIWWFEARNVLVMNERRGRMGGVDLNRAFELLNKLPVVLDREPDETAILRLARRHRLTVYDAAYLDLALRRAAAIATLDKALAGAAVAEGLAVVGS